MARSSRSSHPDLFSATHMVNFTPRQKQVFHEAAKRSLSSLNAYIRDLLTRDIELRAEQDEPYFARLRDELVQHAKLKESAIFGSEARNEEIRDALKLHAELVHGFTEHERYELHKRGLGSE